MADHQTIWRSAGQGFDPVSEFISADAWLAVRLLGGLACGPANLAHICRHAAVTAKDAAPLLDVLVRHGLVRVSGREGFALRFPAQAVSISQIVKAVDGDVLRRVHQEELPEIGEILCRMVTVTADILDNFSLAEAAEP